jgi:hypothetical protein
MSKKSANTARRLFAAAGSDERWVTGDENSLRNNSQPKTQSAAEVINKERDKEKGKSPHTPLKEKETEKETFPEPVPEHHARAGARSRTREGAFRSGSGAVDIRQRISGAGSANRVRIDRDFIMDPAHDAVQIALLVLRIPEVTPPYNNARMMRWALRIIGEEEFRDLVYRQWRENSLDGSAKNAAAAFQAKLNCAVFGPKGGAR